MVDQFFGHLGPSAFLVALGAFAILSGDKGVRLTRIEAWLSICAGAIYILVDTFIMHPPLGIFDGAGHAEQEHVGLMGLVLALGLCGLVILRAGNIPPSLPVVVGVAVAALVFTGHHQHAAAGTVAHNATVLMLVVAAIFRVLERYTEYGVAIIVSGFLFFSAQMGFAMFVESSGTSPQAWVTYWATAGFISSTGFLIVRRAGEQA
ncbi:hypothetical protein GR183_01770 [Stappia sp. GBMRC 2046]|uniref:DUF998 domain-containing protein n=1 Tax=Stappia sediminis TaxID=2692190 RepID=A0A7X3S616_9HYPH|nr:hypothetical protein [Stappia sediminis]MXN63617.1 hypothetical protein [Stappia sediminis]